MKKYTLLEMVNKILSAMDSDEVNSIFDTIESTQVVELIEGVYNDVVTRLEAPEHFNLFTLEGLADTSRPTVMRIPNTVDNLLWVKYNKVSSSETAPKFLPVLYMDKGEFLSRVMNLPYGETGVFQYTLDGVTLLGRNDTPPSYYTSFNDRRVVFDSFDSEVDATLQAAKTQCYGHTIPSFQRLDGFTPDLDANAFSTLWNEAKALAFAEIKQADNAKAEKNARKGWIKLQADKTNVKGVPYRDTLANYGRKR